MSVGIALILATLLIIIVFLARPQQAQQVQPPPPVLQAQPADADRPIIIQTDVDPWRRFDYVDYRPYYFNYSGDVYPARRHYHGPPPRRDFAPRFAPRFGPGSRHGRFGVSGTPAVYVPPRGGGGHRGGRGRGH